MNGVVVLGFFFQQGKDECKAPSTEAGLCGASGPCRPQKSGPTVHGLPEVPHRSDCHKVRIMFYVLLYVLKLTQISFFLVRSGLFMRQHTWR